MPNSEEEIQNLTPTPQFISPIFDKPDPRTPKTEKLKKECKFIEPDQHSPQYS